MEIIPYNRNLKLLARKLRKNMTLSEVLLWNELKRKKVRGYDFDRQRPILNYIVDFYCKKLKLAIEIDGNTHNNQDAIYKDFERQKEIEQWGVRFLRFSDIEVKTDIKNVLRAIELFIDSCR